MKIIKEGDRKFVGVFRVPIFIGKCKECNATFEAQKHEISSTGKMYCPYCQKYHDNYEINYVRTDILMPFNPGTIRRHSYTLEYVTPDKVNTSYVSDDDGITIKNKENHNSLYLYKSKHFHIIVQKILTYIQYLLH